MTNNNQNAILLFLGGSLSAIFLGCKNHGEAKKPSSGNKTGAMDDVDEDDEDAFVNDEGFFSRVRKNRLQNGDAANCSGAILKGKNIARYNQECNNHKFGRIPIADDVVINKTEADLEGWQVFLRVINVNTHVFLQVFEQKDDVSHTYYVGLDVLGKENNRWAEVENSTSNAKFNTRFTGKVGSLDTMISPENLQRHGGAVRGCTRDVKVSDGLNRNRWQITKVIDDGQSFRLCVAGSTMGCLTQKYVGVDNKMVPGKTVHLWQADRGSPRPLFYRFAQEHVDANIPQQLCSRAIFSELSIADGDDHHNIRHASRAFEITVKERTRLVQLVQESAQKISFMLLPFALPSDQSKNVVFNGKSSFYPTAPRPYNCVTFVQYIVEQTTGLVMDFAMNCKPRSDWPSITCFTKLFSIDKVELTSNNGQGVVKISSPNNSNNESISHNEV